MNILVSLWKGKTLSLRSFLYHIISYVSMTFLQKNISIIPLTERKKHIAKKKDKCHSTDNPKGLPGSQITLEGKMCGDDHALDASRLHKIQKQGEGPLMVFKEGKIMVVREGRGEGELLPMKDGSRP